MEPEFEMEYDYKQYNTADRVAKHNVNAVKIYSHIEKPQYRPYLHLERERFVDINYIIRHGSDRFNVLYDPSDRVGISILFSGIDNWEVAEVLLHTTMEQLYLINSLAIPRQPPYHLDESGLPASNLPLLVTMDPYIVMLHYMRLGRPVVYTNKPQVLKKILPEITRVTDESPPTKRVIGLDILGKTKFMEGIVWQESVNAPTYTAVDTIDTDTIKMYKSSVGVYDLVFKMADMRGELLLSTLFILRSVLAAIGLSFQANTKNWYQVFCTTEERPYHGAIEHMLQDEFDEVPDYPIALIPRDTRPIVRPKIRFKHVHICGGVDKGKACRQIYTHTHPITMLGSRHEQTRGACPNTSCSNHILEESLGSNVVVRGSDLKGNLALMYKGTKHREAIMPGFSKPYHEFESIRLKDIYVPPDLRACVPNILYLAFVKHYGIPKRRDMKTFLHKTYQRISRTKMEKKLLRMGYKKLGSVSKPLQLHSDYGRKSKKSTEPDVMPVDFISCYLNMKAGIMPPLTY